MITEGYDFKNSGLSGTPNWMSPESVKSSEFTRFSDIWSLGCTLIEMATGQAPWSEYKNPMSVLYYLSNLNAMPLIPQNLSPELKDFLKCCLKIEAKDRCNVNELLRHPFITGDIIVENNVNNIYNNNFNNDVSNNNLNCDLNMGNNKGYYNSGFTGNKDIELNDNPQMQNEFLSKFKSRGSENYNRNMNCEFAIK